MIIKLRKYIKSQGTTYRDQYYRVAGHIFYWDIEMEGVCIYGTVHMERTGMEPRI